MSGMFRLVLLWAQTKISFSIGADISFEIFKRTLYQSYPVHVSRNSSEIVSGISSKTHNIIYQIIMPLLIVASSVIMLLMIFLALLIIQPYVSIIAFGGFGLIYVVIILLTRKKLYNDSLIIGKQSILVVKILQEGLGGIRDVLLDGSQKFYCKIYKEADSSLRKAQSNVVIIGASPRYAIESLSMILIAVLAYLLGKSEDGLKTALPILGSMALGAQRLLPVLQQAYSSFASILGAEGSLEDTLLLLDQPLLNDNLVLEKVEFKDNLSINNLFFKYGNDLPYVLRDLNLEIKKGSKVGIIGYTGSGKSTLLDLIMGLLFPSEGNITIDGELLTLEKIRAWQNNISHVPQTIFLADASIMENIAFGISKEEMDFDRITVAAQKAKIHHDIISWEDGYNTQVGERGVRLSGGQRQRIGIARALYKQASFIVFDEATSALDDQTEKGVMDAIESLDKSLTILIVAHRLTTLKNCDTIIEVGKGGSLSVLTYEEIINNKS